LPKLIIFNYIMQFTWCICRSKRDTVDAILPYDKLLRVLGSNS